jgi:AbrB family looped-hinge helix DNA binding protein
MNEVRTKLSKGGRVVVPVEYRKALGVQEGDDLILRLEEGEVRISTPASALKQAQDLVRRYVSPEQERSLAEELIAERRQEARNE